MFMLFSAVLSETEGALLFGPYVWTFAAIFAAVVVVGWVASKMGWLYIKKEPAPAKKKNSH